MLQLEAEYVSLIHSIHSSLVPRLPCGLGMRLPIFTLQKPNCCFSKLFGYYSCMTILPMLIYLKDAVVVNYLVEVKFTTVQIWSELVATLLASHYNHCVLLNKHKKGWSRTLFPMLIQKELVRFALPLCELH